MKQRRIVITGMGILAPNGSDLGTFWDSIINGQSAVTEVTRFPTDNIPSKFAAEIKTFDANDHMDRRVARRLERPQQLGVAASRLAVTDAGIDFHKIDADRCGIVEASSLCNVDAAYKGQLAYATKGYRGVGPSMMINGYFGSGSAEIAHQLGIRGHAITCSSSSASGNDALGYAMTMIRDEDVDVMLAGGAEAPLIDTIFVGFSQMKAMSRWDGAPQRAMKPFDQDSDGFVMGEGSAFLVLEELGHALSRDANIYAELVSHARSCEAYHPMVPHPEGLGVQRAMEKCLRKGDIELSEVNYINPHGSANAANDLAESAAIQSLFGDRLNHISVSATKPVTGHSLAAVGALEAVVCALALKNDVIPLTLNHTHPLEGCKLDYVKGKSRPFPLNFVLSLNSGFGGKTSCLAMKKAPR